VLVFRIIVFMKPNTSTLERAFELASSGLYPTVSQIRLKLAREGYPYRLVHGRELKKQLVAAITKARCERVSPP